jgi:hypothetical protein
MNSFSFKAVRKVFAISICVAFALSVLPAKADMIELTNGDHYLGTVVSMTKSNVEFLSEIQGMVKLPREKIAQITLHEVVVKPIIVAKPVAAVQPAPASTAVVTTTTTTGAPTANDVVQQMRTEGVDPKLIDQVQEQIFGKSSPEAAQKFNEMMGGLTSGSLSMQDLRKQAQASIAQIKQAKKEFGSDAGDMLDGYLVILQKFVDESAAESVVPAAPPAPAATTPGK